ncbi:MAG: helix-turn-helix transcriptional regulator [Rhodobacteraceae bacterium]|nr:helix-turn-helix transcriptional regulator [Paracoccaceae bacterium]
MIEPDRLISIYDAALTESRWTPALEALRSATSAKGVLLYETGTHEEISYSTQGASAYYAGMQDLFAEYGALIASDAGTDLDSEGFKLVHERAPFAALEEMSLWDIDADYHARAEIAWGKERLGVFRRFVVNLSEDPSRFSGLIYHYDLTQDTIPAHDLLAANTYAPHLAKALEINRMAYSLRQKYAAVLSVLDKIDLGIAVVSENGAVILANAEARSMIDARDGLRQTQDGRLMCTNEDDAGRMLRAVSEVTQTARGQNTRRGDEFTITRRSTANPILAIVSPLRDADMELEAGLTGALVTLIDTGRQVTTRLDAFCAAYRLTAAETRVAPLLFEGLSARDMADVLGVSPETVRSHVKSILQKTGCSGRVAFVWRVFQFAPPVR